jgi:hypothetical protein
MVKHSIASPVYIIDKDNKIIYSYFDTDYKKASVAELIEHL